MKTPLFTVVILAAAITVSCKNAPQADAQAIDEELSEIVESNEYKDGDLIKLRATEEVIDTDGGNYVVLDLQPDERLPRVANDNFGTYCDNRATIVLLSQSGDTLLSRQFAKADLQEHLDETLRRSAILDGLSLESVTPSSVVVHASVSVPHSDEQAVIAVTLSPSAPLAAQRLSINTDAFPSPDEED